MVNEPTRTGAIVDTAPAKLELQGLSNAALRAELRDAIGMTEAAIRRVAAIWQELVRRGDDMSDLRFALAPVMRAVDEGELLPALVVAMAGQVRSLQRLALLPISDQQRLMEGQEVEIVSADGVKRKPLSALSWPEMTRVVQGGRILTAEEQRTAAATSKPVTPRKSRVVQVRLAPSTYEAAAIAAAKAGLRTDDYLRRLIIEAVEGR